MIADSLSLLFQAESGNTEAASAKLALNSLRGNVSVLRNFMREASHRQSRSAASAETLLDNFRAKTGIAKAAKIQAKVASDLMDDFFSQNISAKIAENLIALTDEWMTLAGQSWKHIGAERRLLEFSHFKTREFEGIEFLPDGSLDVHSQRWKSGWRVGGCRFEPRLVLLPFS